MTPSEMPAQIMSISPAYETTSTAGAFYTDMVTPLEKLLVGFIPKQSGTGTPSPSNIRPIEGWTSVTVNHNGKNLFDRDKPLVPDSYISNDGTIKSSTSYQYSDYYTPVDPNTEYIFSGTFSGSAYNTISFYDVNKNFIGRLVPASPNTGAQFTTPSNCYYIRFNMGKNADLSTIQLEVGSTATTYEAYKFATHTSALGQTVYGGTVDLVSGVLTVDKAMVDLGTMSWFYQSIPNHERFGGTGIRGIVALPASPNVVVDAKCSQYKVITANQTYSHNAGIGISVTSSDGTVYVYDDAYTDPTAFRTAMSGVQFCYPLATPQTYQLTPQQINTLMGNNTLTLDGGEVTEVIYLTHLLPNGYQADGNLVACYRSSDDALGIYDLVNNVFYANAETSNLSVASDTLHANAGIDDLSVASDVSHTSAETDDFPVESDV